MIKIVLLIITLVWVPCFSNFGSGSTFGVSGKFTPLENNHVEMVDELLTIDFYRGFAKVTVKYTMFNHGENITIKGGFPFLGESPRKYSIQLDSIKIPFKDIKGNKVNWFRRLDIENSWLGGEGPAPETAKWKTSELSFKKNQKSKLIITYEQSYETGGHGTDPNNIYYPPTFRYIFHTGSTWKGDIKKGKVILKSHYYSTMHFNKSRVLKNLSKSGQEATASFENFEPEKEDNLVVMLGNDFKGTGFHSGYGLRTNRQVFQNSVTRYNYAIEVPSVLDSTYSTKYLKDLDFATAWCEGNKRSGIGDTISLKVIESDSINSIGIYPGYGKNQQIYFKNNRIKRLSVIVNDKNIYKVKFPDEYVDLSSEYEESYGWTEFGDVGENIEDIKIVIDSIYPGSKFDDTCISEIVLRNKKIFY